MSKSPAEQLRINNAIIEAQARLSVLVKIGNRNLTPQEKRESQFLSQRISCLKAGYGLEEVDARELNDLETRNGLPLTPLNKIKKSQRELRAADFRKFVLEEVRDGGVGSNTPGHYAGLGFFVPAGFIKSVTKLALKAGDAILNPDYVSFIKSTTGAPLALPVANDTSENAVAIGEGAISGTVGDPTVPDVQYPGQVALGAVSYRQTYITSLESFNDVEASGNLLDLWKAWTAARIGRGVSHDMMVGGQTAPIVGIVDQLSNAGVVPQIANGSAEITGGAETGATSIGNKDLADLVFNLNSDYRLSPKCAFWMSDLTLLKLSQLVNKFGNPVVQWQGSLAYILGYPVRICPSLPTPSASQVTVLFGDGSFIYVRRVIDAFTDVRVLKERFIDAGEIGLQSVTRWDMKLAYQGQGNPPFTVLQQSS
jgi:HK97 family phage major capsid protein